MLAAGRVTLGAVKKLTEMGADLLAKNKDGRTALHAAALNGRTRTVEALLVKGAEADAKDNSGRTPLMLAAGNGQRDAAELLIRKGADAYAKDENGQMAVVQARLNGHGNVVAGLEALTKSFFETALRLICKHSATFSACEHSATNSRLLHRLARLATYQMELEAFEATFSRLVCAAVEAKRATLKAGFHKLQLRHPLLTGEQPSPTEAGELLLRLATEAQAARERVERAEQAMPSLDELPRLHEDAWKEHAFARDQARQEQVHFQELRLAGLRATQRCIERALNGELDDGIGPPELPTIDDDLSAVAAPRADSKCASPLSALCAGIIQDVRQLHEEYLGRRQRLEADLQACEADLGRACQEAEICAALHARRTHVEALLGDLERMTPEVARHKKEERSAKCGKEDLEDESAPGDPHLERARAAHKDAEKRLAAILLRRDKVVSQIAELSATPRPRHETVLGEDLSIPLDFPEVLVRTQRIVRGPGYTYAQLDAAGRARYDIEILLRNAGLLVYDRGDKSYTHLEYVSGKPTVKRVTWYGDPKILKDYCVNDFKRVQRAITAASRLRHPGIVRVECAFLPKDRSDIVVVQSPYYSGGNMRQWCQDKDGTARLSAAQKVAEAVRFLHAHGVLHRDLKPENVVFNGDAADATPALCDFDLSVSTMETAQRTVQRGTTLYLAPEPTPSTASDIFALGVTFLDLMLCDGDQDRLRQTLAPGGSRVEVLNRVRAELGRRTEDDELAALISSMLAPEPAERLVAAAVADKLGELLNVRTCVVCHCPEPRDGGIECGAEERHFLCDVCFSEHVESAEALCGEDDVRVKCCGSSHTGCEARFTLRDAAQHAAPVAFETLQRHIKDRLHVSLHESMQKEFDQWKAEFAAKSEMERRALSTRQHIEQMMELRCPQCRHVFGAFDGCAALRCATANCGANFCAFCLADCGADAHPHVLRCRLNPNPGEFFVTEVAWARVVEGERRRKLDEFWGTLEPELKQAMAADVFVRQILRDLRLDPMVV
mmetsp:Transcript_9547/g.29050  ORF Transcript_9547/g.29050 Transcript_9547/m.29050 type:complete len:1012 (-) Transcript_9547:742-3777(-)